MNHLHVVSSASTERVNDIILDPFMGSGTTAFVAKELGRDYIGCELHEGYGKLIQKRLNERRVTVV